MAALRPLRFVLTAILAVAAAFLLSGTASAQSYVGGQPTASASATTVVEGNSLTVTGSGLTPGDQVTATVTPGGRSLGTKTVGVNGVVSFTFSTAGFGPGNFTVRLTSPLGVSLSVPFTVVSASPAGFASGSGGFVSGSGGSVAGSGGSASGSGSSGLAFTGAAAVIPISIAGLALVGLGAGAVIVSRRRQSGAAS